MKIEITKLKTMVLLEAKAALAWKSLSATEQRAYQTAYRATKFHASETDADILDGHQGEDDADIVREHDADEGEWDPHEGFPEEVRSAAEKPKMPKNPKTSMTKPKEPPVGKKVKDGAPEIPAGGPAVASRKRK